MVLDKQRPAKVCTSCPSCKYQALQKGFIRLFVLEPGSYHDRIVGKLQSSQFCNKDEDAGVNNRTHHVDYEALSYVWGSKEHHRYIFIRQTRLSAISITPNLDVALRHLRSRDEPRVLWIDAICIDQSNDVEKSLQVALMSQIFQKARRVVAWLGPEADNSSLAMGAIQRLGSRITVNWPPCAEGTEPFETRAAEGVVGYEWNYASLGPPFDRQELHSIQVLLSREWFKRLWIRQEIHLANSMAIVICGIFQVRWIHFRNTMSALFTQTPESPYHNIKLRQFMAQLKGFIYQGPSVDLLRLREYFDHTDCLDQRDRVYAVMDFLRERRDLQIVPDYTKTTAQVFEDLVIQWIRLYRSFAIIAACRLEPGLSAPSWVPNWSNRVDDSMRLFNSTCASSQLTTGLVNITDHVLETTGRTISEIESVIECPFHKHSSTFNDMKAIGDIVQVALRMSRLDVNSFVERCAPILIFGRTADFRQYPRKGEPMLKECKHLLASMALHQYPSESDVMSDNQVLVGSSWMPALKIRLIVQGITSTLKGCKLLFGSNGSIGLATSHTQAGDLVCVLLDCYAPMILRPLRADQFLVVGPCYVGGMSHGEAFLGSFPDSVRPVKVGTNNGIARWGFKNELSGEIVREDPRLAALDIGLEDFREALIKDPDAKLSIDLEVLRNKGVDIQSFKLV